GGGGGGRGARGGHCVDGGRGAGVLVYRSRGRREIALCSLPAWIGLTKALRMGHTPEQFGAKPGQKWPILAIRRFLLYDVFLHELGHLQLIDDHARSERLKFARERRAEEFAVEWCARLWSEPFAHPDPVHGPPSPEELYLGGSSAGTTR